MKPYGICLFLTGLFHLAQCSLGLSMLLQRVRILLKKNPHLRIMSLLIFERDRERKTFMWEINMDQLPPKCALTGQPRHVPRPGIEPAIFRSTGWCFNEMSHLVRARFPTFLCLPSIPLCKCTTVFLSTDVSLGGFYFIYPKLQEIFYCSKLNDLDYRGI